MMPTFAAWAGLPAPAGIDGISVVEAFSGSPLSFPHPYLNWDYGHNRDRYDQAVRMGNWKGIKLGVGSPLQLFDLSKDLRESNDIAEHHPDVVAQIERIMKDSYVPDDRYKIGEIYRGSKLWRHTMFKSR